MKDQKSKFKMSYVVMLLLIVALLCLIFIPSGYKGVLLVDRENDMVELINGEYKRDDQSEAQQIIAFYHKDGVAYVLVKDSKFEASFPKYSDYYFYFDRYAESDMIDRINKLIQEHNSTEGAIQIQNSGPMPNGINWWDIIYPILYIGFGIFLIWMIFKMIGGANKGAMSFGKSNARAYISSKVKFADVAGTEEEKEELAEIVEFLKNPRKFTQLGARIPKGVLLVGPPGTGKTLLARAVAGEANVPFISISGSDFVEMFVGVGASRVRDLFEQAKAKKPCIIFIDEIDAVGRQRGAGLGGGNDEREQTLNQLLVEMDGFESNEGIIVLAATNRSDVLDPALMRPGRFDRQIYVNIPDVKGREGILKIHAKNKPIDENVDFNVLAKITVGFTGADIENMLNEAAILAARANRPKIIMTDITEGINKVMMGPQKKSRLVTEKDKKLTAYHEAGHAILARKLPHCDTVQEVSIIPRGGAAGYTMQRPENDDRSDTYNHLMDEIAMSMGGRIAEELIFKDITTGASGDINHATKIAHNMVYRYGMSKRLGFISLDTSEQVFIGRDYQTKNDFSDKLASEADDEIREILDYNYKRAKKILSENTTLLHEMVKLLLERETIYKYETDLLVEGKSADEIMKLLEKKDKAQKAKEDEERKRLAQQAKLDTYKQKIIDGEKLLNAGIISKEEYDAIKKEYENFVSELEKAEKPAEVKVTITAGEKPKASAKPATEKKEPAKKVATKKVETVKKEEPKLAEKKAEPTKERSAKEILKEKLNRQKSTKTDDDNKGE